MGRPRYVALGLSRYYQAPMNGPWTYRPGKDRNFTREQAEADFEWMVQRPEKYGAVRLVKSYFARGHLQKDVLRAVSLLPRLPPAFTGIEQGRQIILAVE